jgi:glycine cleavage system H protein
LNIPQDLLYSKEHEWVRVSGDSAEIGITDYAQGELGDIVFVELSAEGDEVKESEPFGTIEAVKAVSELFSPISGSIAAVNSKIEEDAGIINNDPYGEGWMVKITISDSSELEGLMQADQYKELIGE